MQKHKESTEVYKRDIEFFFLPLSEQIEKILKASIVLFFFSLLLAQAFLLSGENQQAMVNKAIRYEGVFHEDPIEAKATLQRR